MLRFYTADLHIHTVLSACAEIEMLPELIVERAQELGLGLVAVTDHNSAENSAAMLAAARETGIAVLPGMEVQTREEVHLLCLFDTLEQVTCWQREVYDHLPLLRNRDDVFGTQVVLDVSGAIVGRNDRLLMTSTSFTVEQAAHRVHGLDGVCIPAHVDRPAYSIIANLGFVPPGLDIVGVEISPNTGPVQAREDYPQLASYSLVAGGDAHRLGEVTRRMTLKMADASVAEISLALAGAHGRGAWIDGIWSVKSP